MAEDSGECKLPENPEWPTDDGYTNAESDGIEGKDKYNLLCGDVRLREGQSMREVSKFCLLSDS